MKSLLTSLSMAGGGIRQRARRFRSRFGLPAVRLIFDHRYTLPSNDLIDGRRGERILKYLISHDHISTKDVEHPAKLGLDVALRVHSYDYLTKLDDPTELSHIFATRHRTEGDPAAILNAQRWASAGTVHAALAAFRYPWLTSPIVNLGGGFHHARRNRGAGFCALNDVAMAIARLRAAELTKKILVVDLDLHQGDGTRSFFADDPTVYTCSVHNQSWDDSPAVATLDVALGPAVGDATFMRALRETLPEAFDRAQPGFVFYVAGADPAATDALGDWRLSADTMFERDRMVFARAKGIPTVMVLAGGYGPNAWRYPARTIAWLSSGMDVPVPTADERDMGKFRSIRKSIADVVLRGDGGPPIDEDAFRITEADLYGDLFEKAPDKKLMGFYSTFGLEVAFEQYGLAKHLRERGYPGFVIDPGGLKRESGQGIRVFADSTKRDVLIELLLSDFVLEIPPSDRTNAHDEPLIARLLSIEWLLLQDPKRSFGPGGADAARLLPGQKHPGLGCLTIVFGMLVMMCERLGFDGITSVPAHFHVAAQARRLMAFVRPEDEAYYLALAHATEGMPLPEASMAISAGRVMNARSGAPAPWRPARMVLALGEGLKAHVTSPGYAHRVEDAARELHLTLQPNET